MSIFLAADKLNEKIKEWKDDSKSLSEICELSTYYLEATYPHLC